MSTDDDGGLFNFTPDELEPPNDDSDPGTGDQAAPDTRGEDEHEVGGGQTGMGKGPTGS